MSKIKTIILFYAYRSNSCYIFKPVFEKVSEDKKYKDIIFKEVDVSTDEGLEESEEYGIQIIPSTIFLGENDFFLGKTIGNIALDSFKKEIDKANG